MPAKTIAPYTLTSFGELTDGTVFVATFKYEHLQDELPLGLCWDEVYHEIAKPNPYSGELVKFADHYYCLGGNSGGSYDSDQAVITGPPLSQTEKRAGQLKANELKVLLRLFECKADNHRATRAELYGAVGSHFAFVSAVRHLEQVSLAHAYKGAFGRQYFVQLTCSGVVRALQELSS